MPFGVKANVKAPHRFLRSGAVCWVRLANQGNGGERLYVRGMSRSGRVVSTWVDARDLHNFRPAWVQPSTGYWHSMPFDTKEQAQAWADQMNAMYGQTPVREHARQFGRVANK